VFFDPGETQFDLRFRLFGTGVRVHPMFWVISAALGWPGDPQGLGSMFLPLLLIWIACVFVSILVHEMGHVLAGRLFGSHGHILLYSMGGLAIGSSALDRRGQRIAVYAAGPAAGFLLLALVWGGVNLSGVTDRGLPLLARVAYRDLIWINLFWGLLNLLPIWPLDGGQISRDVLTGLAPARGVYLSLGISTVVAALLAAHALATYFSPAYRERLPEYLLGTGDLFLALFFGMMALSSFAALQHLERQRRDWDDHWED
jgi:Zn-dependent protease